MAKEVKKSLGPEPVAERSTRSSISKPKPTPKPTLVRTATHVQILKKRGRPSKASLATRKEAEAEREAEPELEAEPSASSLPSALGKRKPSAGSQPYTPPKSSIKKNLRDAKRLNTSSTKKVDLVDPTALEDDEEDPRYPASPVHMPPRAAKEKVSKAKAVGAQAKTRGKGGKGVTAMTGNLSKGTTRSGIKFGI